MVQIIETTAINGSEYKIVINFESPPKPIQIYITKDVDHPKFGGYVYTISNKKHLKQGQELIVNQLVLSNGENNDYNKSMGNLILRKFGNANYVNMNDIEEFDFKPLLGVVIEMISNSSV